MFTHQAGHSYQDFNSLPIKIFISPYKALCCHKLSFSITKLSLFCTLRNVSVLFFRSVSKVKLTPQCLEKSLDKTISCCLKTMIQIQKAVSYMQDFTVFDIHLHASLSLQARILMTLIIFEYINEVIHCV